MDFTVERNNLHWHQFIAIEADLVRVARFIEIHDDNMDTYSIELVRLLLATCAQVEIVGKSIASIAGKTPKNIEDLRKALTASNPEVGAAEVLLPQYGHATFPWEAWLRGETPSWWLANNKLKHDDANAFKHASLRNCIDASAGLLVLLLAAGHARQVDAFKPSTQLLYPPITMAIPDMGTDGGIMNLEYARSKSAQTE